MRTILFLVTLTLVTTAALAQQPAAAPEEKVGEAPTVPTGQTASEAAASVAESGVISKINVQGNRRVETDAIRAALPLKVGDTFDREKLKSALLAVWRMGYFNDVKLDVSAAKPPLRGFVLTVLVSEKPAVREVKLEGNEELSKDDLKDTVEVKASRSSTRRRCGSRRRRSRRSTWRRATSSPR
jgi:outer membrane protein insertion porin family